MKNENLKSFQKHVGELIYYRYAEAKYNLIAKEAMIQIYQNEASEEIKKEMILSLYRILIIKCRSHHRESHAFAAITMDNLLTGVIIN